MKLQFKHQPFQAEAAAAVCDVFRGQSLCAQALPTGRCPWQGPAPACATNPWLRS